MSGYKEKQKSLKGPDRFQYELMSFFDWLKARWKVTALIVSGLVLIALFGFGFYYYQKSLAEVRQEGLAKIDYAFEKEENETYEKKRAVYQKMFAQQSEKKNKTDEEKKKDIEALRTQLESIKPDHEKTYVQYKEFYEKHKTHAEGWKAGVTVAGILTEKKDIEGAKKILGEILEQNTSKYFFRVRARLMYISLLEELASYDDALKEVEKLLAFNDESLNPEAMIIQSRLLYNKGDKGKAIETLDKLISQYSSTDEAQKARSLKTIWRQS